MRIHTDHNGVAVNAIHTTFSSTSAEGIDVRGHVYQILHGAGSTGISFQNGPVKEHGVNGVTNEALLAILIDRIEFLNGKFHSADNDKALNHCKLALEALERRTKERMARGVEGLEQA